MNFRAHVRYRVSSRSIWAMEGDSVSKQQKTKLGYGTPLSPAFREQRQAELWPESTLTLTH